jgi:hypothetical protein
LFGTLDVFWGNMTAVDSSGRLVVQAVDRSEHGLTVFDALARVFGHLRSDVSTPAGLPAPLMPLLQFLQVGKIGKGEHTIGELARLMYAKGYDFGHFLAMSIPTMMIETIVRIAYAMKRLREGHDLVDALPISIPGRTRPPKLQTMLFVAHLLATGVNAGRVAITKNPLAINYPEWLAFAKTALQQLRWVLFEKEEVRLAHVQKRIDGDWDALRHAMALSWG